MDFDDEIAYCLMREQVERRAASQADGAAAHDAHFMMAERYADRASCLIERRDDRYSANRRKIRDQALVLVAISGARLPSRSRL